MQNSSRFNEDRYGFAVALIYNKRQRSSLLSIEEGPLLYLYNLCSITIYFIAYIHVSYTRNTATYRKCIASFTSCIGCTSVIRYLCSTIIQATEYRILSIPCLGR